MRSDRAVRRTRTKIGLATMMIGAVLAVSGAGMAPAGADHNGSIRICHAASATKNPYQSQTVDSSSIDGVGAGDHFLQHTGPVWNAAMPNNGGWGDIIPPLPGHHLGLNWDATGQAIHANGCTPPGTTPATYVCSAATGVTQTSATLHASTTDAAVTSATFTLNPGGTVLVDNTAPFSVTANALTPNTAYTYSVVFNPGSLPQTNAACGFTTLPSGGTPTYVCSAATGVTQTSATLHASTTDAAVTSATFTLNPGGTVLVDNTAPFAVTANGLTPNTAYTYSVVFNPGSLPQTNAACGFTTLGSGSPPPPPATSPQLSASLTCAEGGFRVTVSNSGDADGTVDILSDGVVVVNDLAVPLGDSATAVVSVEEEDDYDMEVNDGIDVVAAFAGTRDCVDVGGVVVPGPTPTPGPTPAPVPAPTPAAQELPRTGGDALPMAELGLGLILLGAGVMIASREELRTA